MKSSRSLLFFALFALATAPALAQSAGTGGGGSTGGASTGGGSHSAAGTTGGSSEPTQGVGTGVDSGSAANDGSATDDGVTDDTSATSDDAGGAGSTSGETTDDSGIISNEDPASADDGFSPGDAAPRQEPDIREDRFNTEPRVPAQPGLVGEDNADAGGAGTTNDGAGTGAGIVAPEDAVDPTVGDRDATRQMNGTAGSRVPATDIR